MLKGFKVIALILAIGLLFSGCGESRHLKDLVIAEGMGIDSADNSEEIEITVQTLNIGINSGYESQQGNMTINTQKKADSITNGINNLSKSLSKRLFFGQNKLIVIGKEIAENYLEKNLDYFFRSSDSRNDVAVCVSSSSAKDILESTENDSAVPCENILYLLENNEISGLSVLVTTGELMNLYADKTSDIYMPVLEKSNEDSVSTAGIALFNDNKLVCVTDDEETLGFTLIAGKADSVLLEIEDDVYGKIGVRISDIQCKKSASVIDNNVCFNVKIEADMIIDEVQNSTESETQLNEIAGITEEHIKKLCENAFLLCRDNSCDCLRVGEYLAAGDSASYEYMSINWDKYFSSCVIKADADTRLKKVSDNTQAE